jgi:hypothetical protein
LSERPDRKQGSLRIWLRIALATVVVAGLAVITSGREGPETDRGFTPLDGRSTAASVKRCGVSEARRVARVWFRGMSSGEPDRVRVVTSRGKPVPRYVITIDDGGRFRTVGIPSRASAVKVVPELVGATAARRSLTVTKIGNPPMAADIRSPLSGRLAGIEFSARVGEAKWSGKAGVRCGSETAYFAAFRVSNAN